ncbi:hypothetical protein BDA99DRAFT_513627, partial [Phascolomyces articulosus]
MDEKKGPDPTLHSSDNLKDGLQLEPKEPRNFVSIDNEASTKDAVASTSENDDSLTRLCCCSSAKTSCNCSCSDCHNDNLSSKPKKRSWYSVLLYIYMAVLAYKFLRKCGSVFNAFFSSPITEIQLQGCGEWPLKLDYPSSFPRVNTLNDLDESMNFLASRYGKEILGPCFVETSDNNNPLNHLDINEPTTASSAESHVSVGANTEMGDANHYENTLSHDTHVVGKRQQSYKLTTSASFPILDIHSFIVTADDNIELDINIVKSNSTIVNNNNDDPSVLQQQNENDVRMYLTRIYDNKEEEDKNLVSVNDKGDLESDDDDDFSSAIIYLDHFMGHLTVRIKHTMVNGNQDNDDEKMPKYKLHITLPTSQQINGDDAIIIKEHIFTIPEISVSIKQGKVRAQNMEFDQLYVRIGHGKVNLSSIEVKKLVVAVLDGSIYLPGVKFTESVAAGVIRGSSTVLAKIRRHVQPYNLINMCADGHAFTYVMTTVDNSEGMAANFYIHRDVGRPPCCEKYPMSLPGDTYYYPDEGDIFHVDKNSTDILKTGYMISKDSGSNVLVYSGAKSAESCKTKCCNRFRSRFYYNPN